MGRNLPKRRTQGRFVRGHPEVLGTEPLATYASVEEHEKLVRAGVARLRERFFVLCTRRGQMSSSGLEMLSCHVVKRRDDATTKLRLIIDMLRSHVNERLRVHERIVLPRIVDMERDSVSLLEGSSDGGDVDIDRDAFHTIGV